MTDNDGAEDMGTVAAYAFDVARDEIAHSEAARRALEDANKAMAMHIASQRVGSYGEVLRGAAPLHEGPLIVGGRAIRDAYGAVAEENQQLRGEVISTLLERRSPSSVLPRSGADSSICRCGALLAQLFRLLDQELRAHEQAAWAEQRTALEADRERLAAELAFVAARLRALESAIRRDPFLVRKFAELVAPRASLDLQAQLETTRDLVRELQVQLYIEQSTARKWLPQVRALQAAAQDFFDTLKREIDLGSARGAFAAGYGYSGGGVVAGVGAEVAGTGEGARSGCATARVLHQVPHKFAPPARIEAAYEAAANATARAEAESKRSEVLLDRVAALEAEVARLRIVESAGTSAAAPKAAAGSSSAALAQADRLLAGEPLFAEGPAPDPVLATALADLRRAELASFSLDRRINDENLLPPGREWGEGAPRDGGARDGAQLNGSSSDDDGGRDCCGGGRGGGRTASRAAAAAVAAELHAFKARYRLQLSQLRRSVKEARAAVFEALGKGAALGRGLAPAGEQPGPPAPTAAEVDDLRQRLAAVQHRAEAEAQRLQAALDRAHADLREARDRCSRAETLLRYAEGGERGAPPAVGPSPPPTGLSAEDERFARIAAGPQEDGAAGAGAGRGGGGRGGANASLPVDSDTDTTVNSLLPAESKLLQKPKTKFKGSKATLKESKTGKAETAEEGAKQSAARRSGKAHGEDRRVAAAEGVDLTGVGRHRSESRSSSGYSDLSVETEGLPEDADVPPPLLAKIATLEGRIAEQWAQEQSAQLSGRPVIQLQCADVPGLGVVCVDPRLFDKPTENLTRFFAAVFTAYGSIGAGWSAWCGSNRRSALSHTEFLKGARRMQQGDLILDLGTVFHHLAKEDGDAVCLGDLYTAFEGDAFSVPRLHRRLVECFGNPPRGELGVMVTRADFLTFAAQWCGVKNKDSAKFFDSIDRKKRGFLPVRTIKKVISGELTPKDARKEVAKLTSPESAAPGDEPVARPVTDVAPALKALVADAETRIAASDAPVAFLSPRKGSGAASGDGDGGSGGDGYSSASEAVETDAGLMPTEVKSIGRRLLEATEPFASFPPAVLEAFVQAGTVETFDVGETLHYINDDVREFRFIVVGTAASTQACTTVAHYRPGDHFGAPEIIAGGAQRASNDELVAISRLSTLSLDEKQFVSIFKKHLTAFEASGAAEASATGTAAPASPASPAPAGAALPAAAPPAAAKKKKGKKAAAAAESAAAPAAATPPPSAVRPVGSSSPLAARMLRSLKRNKISIIRIFHMMKPIESVGPSDEMYVSYENFAPMIKRMFLKPPAQNEEIQDLFTELVRPTGTHLYLSSLYRNLLGDDRVPGKRLLLKLREFIRWKVEQGDAVPNDLTKENLKQLMDAVGASSFEPLWARLSAPSRESIRWETLERVLNGEISTTAEIEAAEQNARSLVVPVASFFGLDSLFAATADEFAAADAEPLAPPPPPLDAAAREAEMARVERLISDEYEDVVIVQREQHRMYPEEVTAIKDELRCHAPWNMLHEDQARYLISLMTRFVASPATRAFEEGSAARLVVVVSGALERLQAGLFGFETKMAGPNAGPGAVLGQQQLLGEADAGGAGGGGNGGSVIPLEQRVMAYSAVVTGTSDCVWWELSREAWENDIKPIVRTRQARLPHIMQALRLVPHIQDLNQADLERVAQCAKVEAFYQGATVSKQNRPADKLCVILRGRVVSVVDQERGGPTEKLGYKNTCDYFGEMSLIKNSLRVASCIAETDVKLLTLDHEVFDVVLRPAGVAAKMAEEATRIYKPITKKQPRRNEKRRSTALFFPGQSKIKGGGGTQFDKETGARIPGWTFAETPAKFHKPVLGSAAKPAKSVLRKGIGAQSGSRTSKTKNVCFDAASLVPQKDL